MYKKENRRSSYLYAYIVRNVNLAEFLETEIGCSLNWSEPDISAKTVCPMPNHREDQPSFRLTLEENGVWVYHCFGCGCKGTIVHFFMGYYGLSRKDAILAICKKFDIEDSDKLITKELIESSDNANAKASIKKRIECANINSSSQCRELLKKDYNRYNTWVASSYKKLNKALDELDLDTIESIGFEASNKIQEK